MSEKRRDNKGRVLRTGESQRPDGRYEYRYFDARGVRRSAYSWKLVETDKVPEGKRCKEALRTMERKIDRDVEDQINSFDASRTTLNQYFERYIKDKRNLKESTRSNYTYMYNKYISQTLGFKTLSSIKYTDVKRLYESLILDTGFKPRSMEVIHTILHPIFASAVLDGDIRVNPSEGVMTEIKRNYDWEKAKKSALTEEEQGSFMRFIRQSQYRRWVPLFTVMFGTGCRIGEVLGLRWKDCDFDNNIIDVNHTLMFRALHKERGRFYVTTPKSKAGIRIVPMLREVKRELLALKKEQFKSPPKHVDVDGYTDFIFRNRVEDPLSAHNINKVINHIIRDHNLEADKRSAAGEKVVYLPHFSCHTARHTFCTRFCENETNLKVIQEIMGHADISTTMDVYNEATTKKKMESFENLEGKIKIG